MNIAFYVSGSAGRLKKILQRADPAVLDSLKLIFSDDVQNEYLDDMTSDKNIQYRCLNFEDIPKTQTESRSLIMSNALLDALKKDNIDYCFSFGDHLLVGEILDAYKNRIINFHPSVLPMFPGMKSIDQAIDDDAFLLGNTAHFIDEGMDTGPVIMQNVVTTEVFKKGGYEAVLDQQLPMFYQLFDWLVSERLHVVEGVARVDGADYDQAAFFPKVEA